MSKMVNKVKQNKEVKENAVKNYMNGISYTLNPLDTLKLVSASSIFGEPQYYRDGEFTKRGLSDGVFSIYPKFSNYIIDELKSMNNKKTSDIMEEVIDKSLDFDFHSTLLWAVELRKNYYMRLNPQVIMVRAATHPKRVEFSKTHEGEFARINSLVMSRADEPSTQLTYYLFKNKNKSSIPNILKRSWAKRIEGMSNREIYKYKNSGIGLIDTVRVCHAHNENIDKLMSTGNIDIEENSRTWENLKSEGKTWAEILSSIKLGHMALLRNLRGIFSEIDNQELCNNVLAQLKGGVLNGKQFPFRYFTAYNIIKKSGNINFQPQILDALEECIDIACDNMPKLKGKTVCLSDNSGSAWGGITSEYGRTVVADIDNLSSVITAKNSDEGYVGKFGNELHMIPVSKKNGVLSQANDVRNNPNYTVGGATENGIWLFFKDAIDNKKLYDNIFIYSDMQAGHGGLYGTDLGRKEYCSRCYNIGAYIDVAKLIDVYRKQVNHKVNVFCIQTAGYDNVLIPETGYRTSILYGWTGKELVYADTINKFWDEKDARN